MFVDNNFQLKFLYLPIQEKSQGANPNNSYRMNDLPISYY